MRLLIIWITAFLITPLMATQNISLYYDLIKAGKIDSVRRVVPELQKKSPRDPEVLFLAATVEEDGEKALLLYKDILSQYPHSERADDALTKIIEYLFTKGLYKKTIDYSKRMINRYPKSDQVGSCIYMLLSSFSMMNNKDSVDFYYAFYKKRYPDLQIYFYDYQTAPRYVTDEEFLTQPRTVRETPSRAESVREAIEARESWTIQVGAFGDPNNAFVLKQKLQDLGYDPYVQKIKGSKRDLLAVRVGNFDSRPAAESVGRRLKQDNDLDYIIIRRNRWE